MTNLRIASALVNITMATRRNTSKDRDVIVTDDALAEENRIAAQKVACRDDLL